MTAGISTTSSAVDQPDRLPITALLAGAGLVLAGAATLMPWVTLFGGQVEVAGYQLDGGYLAGAAILAAGLLVVSRVWGGGMLRPLAMLLGAIVVGDAILSGLRIGAYVANPGPAGPLTLPVAGVGPWAMALGGLLVVAAAVVAPSNERALRRDQILRIGLAGALLVAGWIHLLLVPEHLGESTLLGIGFGAAAVAQLALAGLAFRAGQRTIFAVLAVNIAVLVVYAYAVLIGLPIEDHDGAVGLVLGAGEPVDALGAACFAAEVAAVALAAMLLGPRDRGSLEG